MQYVIGAVVLVLVMFAFLQSGGNRTKRPRRVSIDAINDALNKGEQARVAGKFEDAKFHFSQAEHYARNNQNHVLIAESFYGMAKVFEDCKLYPLAVRHVGFAIQSLEPVRAEFGPYYSMLTSYKEELAAKAG